MSSLQNSGHHAPPPPHPPLSSLQNSLVSLGLKYTYTQYKLYKNLPNLSFAKLTTHCKNLGKVYYKATQSKNIKLPAQIVDQY